MKARQSKAICVQQSFPRPQPMHEGGTRQRTAGQAGQIVVEYVLLLVISVMIAALITSQMVSRNPENPGFLISKWQQILTWIGTDDPDVP